MWDVTVLVACALALPLISGLLPAFARATPSLERALVKLLGLLQSLFWLMAFAALIVLALGNSDVVVGAWSPSSITGMPMILKLDRSNALLAICGLLVIAQGWLLRGVARPRHGMLAATWIGLVCATSWPALLVFLGLLDLTVALLRERGADGQDRTSSNFINALSTAMIGVACAIQMAGENSNYLPLARLTSNASGWAVAGAGLRVFMAFVTPRFSLANWSRASGFLLLAKFVAMGATPPSPQWFWVFCAVGALLLAHAFLYRRAINPLELTVTGAVPFALANSAAWQPDSLRLAAGSLLIAHALFTIPLSNVARRVTLGLRFVGAATLAGLPFLPGFAAGAGSLGTAMQKGAGLAVILWLLGFIFVAACALSLVFHQPSIMGEEALSQAQVPAVGRGAFAIGFVLTLLAVIWPLVAGTGQDFLARPSLFEWVIRAVGLISGIALWRFDQTLTGRLNVAMGELWRVTLTERVAEIFGLSWLRGPVGPSIERMSRPFGSIFVFLESEGALLWTIVAVLVLYLVNRQAGP